MFVSGNGRAALRTVSVGHTNGLDAEILSGLKAGEQIVVHPSDRVADGVRITERGQ
jgi:HlyD family secretion protein